jgi:hypothetical protein
MDLRAKIVLFALPALTVWGYFDERAAAWLPWPAFVAGALAGLFLSFKGATWGLANNMAGTFAMIRSAQKHGTDHGFHATRIDWQRRMRVTVWLITACCVVGYFALFAINPDFAIGQAIMAIAAWLGAWWVSGWILDDEPAPPPSLRSRGHYVKPPPPGDPTGSPPPQP